MPRGRRRYDDDYDDSDDEDSDLDEDEEEDDRTWRRNQKIRRKLSSVGTTLIIAAVLGVVGNLGYHQVSKAIEGNNPKPPPPGVDEVNWKRGQDSAFFCTMVISGCVYLPVFFGGYGLTQGRGLALGVTGAIMAMLPCSPGFWPGYRSASGRWWP